MHQILTLKKTRILSVETHKNNAPTAMHIPDILVVEKCNKTAGPRIFVKILTPGVGTRDREVYATRFIRSDPTDPTDPIHVSSANQIRVSDTGYKFDWV